LPDNYYETILKHRDHRSPRAVTLLFAFSGANAAYPKVPKEVQEEANAKLVALRKRSDDIWKRAQPTIEAWAAKGKPYIPWAAKPEDLPQAPIPAFPGAQGGGMYSFGGRGCKVYVVMNLDDSGPGSFREALEAAGPRIVVFNVAGIIKLNERIIQAGTDDAPRRSDRPSHLEAGVAPQSPLQR
jgi:hypothetical protein